MREVDLHAYSLPEKPVWCLLSGWCFLYLVARALAVEKFDTWLC